MTRTGIAILLLLAAAAAATGRFGIAAHGLVLNPGPPLIDERDLTIMIIDGDTLHLSFIPAPEKPAHRGPLTEDDYAEIAAQLGIEPEAIHAVVDIEAGATHSGFSKENMPIINFDLRVFRRTAERRKINLGQHSASEALGNLNVRKYGSQQAAQHARLAAAMKIDSITAIESTFWGMFQIGGFNWKLCGAASPQDFVDRCSRSEFDQLQLFANFITNTGLTKYLKDKNWAAFAKYYNGPAYASQGYHTKMANAYQKYKAKNKASNPTTT
ncbi:MAG: N-acetylmuramidase family protein [Muribaculaceae bacterium]|nr:N-acetylmuramidase family protein [Muribaculaceae bacterium]